ncbi:membrane protein [Cytobacillus firmus]|uniref:CPBP family intramembrane glutamic endopeptidase n=1 Tax=Cytobacillus firmus TaxID=1399 RepID=UPI00077CB806|nr:CPBP family intramembrane glutamic endopeptidase [Cytobacillus firmus]MBG9544961.1 membrane protein [Cytobacillus firmus]MBG9551375.1 membrane protein [Cytobacillus firmus]MBG9558539.1 membrane protein [Cytobacillus firmus]MBG9577171.1 membrane protein [Cytobacillus firmus]MEC1892056.1 CPBP family intramembrane metalloprotease [Cytobacillus firmus]
MKKRYEDIIKELTDKELLFHLYLTQVLILAIAFILSIILFNSFEEFQALFVLDDINILVIGAAAGLAVVLIDIVLMKLLPEEMYDDGGLNKKIFQNRHFLHIAFIAAVVAISEELLFRGVIQTHFGLVISSLIFALVHYRYLFNWFLFVNIITLSFFIGYIYHITNNLLVTIVMHFLIDFLLGILIRKRYLNRGKCNEQ